MRAGTEAKTVDYNLLVQWQRNMRLHATSGWREGEIHSLVDTPVDKEG